MKRETIEDIAIIGGLIGAQFVYAGNSVLLSYLMSIGFTSSNIVIFSTFATFIILSPFAFYFERLILSFVLLFLMNIDYNINGLFFLVIFFLLFIVLYLGLV